VRENLIAFRPRDVGDQQRPDARHRQGSPFQRPSEAKPVIEEACCAKPTWPPSIGFLPEQRPNRQMCSFPVAISKDWKG